jgi:phage baseplate assembly protein W
MSVPVDLSLSLLPKRPSSPAAELASRVRMVLETRPGRIPWMPDFGCDLSGLVGAVAEQSRLSEVRLRIASSLRRWVPGVRITTCEVRLVDVSAAIRDSRVPIAELALGSAGLSARLEVHLVIETESGPVDIEADLSP